jgi:acyl carrier protein
MDDVRARLSKCFLVVFPKLKPEEVPSASNQTLASWDSLATVTLVNVIEEEFGVQIDPDDFGKLLSFTDAEALVKGAG